MSTFILTNEEGDRQVVDSGSSNGEIAALLDGGYDFSSESGDEMVAMLADDGSGQQTVDHVPARNVRAYQRDMSQTTGRRPTIITGDAGVRDYVDNIRSMEARAQRVQEMSNSWEGLGVALGTGAIAPFIALGQGVRAMQGREPAREVFGYNLSEIGEARPFSQTAGNIIGMIGTGGAGAIGGAGIRAAQFAGRLGAPRIGQVAAGLAVEEALWTAGSTLPLAMMEGQPQLSAEALLGGAAFGGAVGLIAGPYMRAWHRSRGAGQRQIFADVAATPGTGPMQQLIELNRNPPLQPRAAPIADAEADELASLIGRFPDALFPSAEARSAGATMGGRFGARAFTWLQRVSEHRLRNREAVGGMPQADRLDYRNEEFVRDNMIPNQSADEAVVTREKMAQQARDSVFQPLLRRFQSLFDESATGVNNLPRTAYSDLAAAAPQNARVASTQLMDQLDEIRKGYSIRDGRKLREFEREVQNAQLTALEDAMLPPKSIRSSSAGDRIRAAEEGVRSQRRTRPLSKAEVSQINRDVFERILKKYEDLQLKKDNPQLRQIITRLRETSDGMYQRLKGTKEGADPELARYLADTLLGVRSIASDGKQFAGDIPGMPVLERNIQEVLQGNRNAEELSSAKEAVGNNPVFSDALHARFRTINAAYSLRKEGGSFKRLMDRFGADDWKPGKPPKISAEKITKYLASKAKNTEEFEAAVKEIKADLEEVTRVSQEVNTLLGKGKKEFDDFNVGETNSLDEFFRVEQNQGKHAANMSSYNNKTPSSLASHGFAQAFGGFVGTLINPLLGWLTGGAAAVTALSMREMDRNPAQYLLMQGKVRTRLLDYGRSLDSGTREVGSRMRSAARVVRSGARGTRMASRGLGFTILDERTSREQRIEQYNVLRDRFTSLANDPLALTDELEMSFATMENMSPEVTHYMRERAVLGVQYMAQSMTPPTTDPLSTDIVSIPPTMAEVDAFTRRFRALQDPLSILDDLARGFVTAEAAETVRVVYPNIMADISANIGQEIMDMGPDAANIPYQMRTNLSLMLGTPTHTTLDGSFVRAMNSRFAQTPQQAEAQGLSRMRTRNLNVASSFMTDAQALSER